MDVIKQFSVPPVRNLARFRTDGTAFFYHAYFLPTFGPYGAVP